eukprot:Em0003g1361a
MADWNPPPPERDEGSASNVVPDKDRIGDTVFSKAWVLSLLVKAVKAVDSSTSEPERESAYGSSGEGGKPGGKEEVVKGEETGVRGEAGSAAGRKEGEEREGHCTLATEVKELSEDIENDLCQLWDVSMNEDVTKYLVDHHAVDLLLEVASRSDAPRLIEICVGILGNLACQEEVCENNFANTETIASILLLLKNTDPLVLLETTRLIYTCVCHKSVFAEWINMIKVTTSVQDDLIFVLKSSTNEDLLKNVAVLLDKLLDCSDELLNDWATKDLLLAICEACEQTKLSSFDATCTFVLTMQLFATTASGTAVIVDCKEELCVVLAEYLCSVEVVDHGAATMAALSLLITLLDNLRMGLPVDILPTLRTLKTRLESSVSKDQRTISRSHDEHDGLCQQNRVAECATSTGMESPDFDPLAEKMLKMVGELVQRLDR